jgi:hypothetical protein
MMAFISQMIATAVARHSNLATAGLLRHRDNANAATETAAENMHQDFVVYLCTMIR